MVGFIPRCLKICETCDNYERHGDSFECKITGIFWLNCDKDKNWKNEQAEKELGKQNSSQEIEW